MQFGMYTYCSILWIFSVIFNVCTPSPLPQIVPYACGQGLIYANGQCISNEVISPVPIVTQPCTITDPCCSCQTKITQTCQTAQPCQTTHVCQPIQPCQPVQPVQPCQVAQPCQTTQPTQIGQTCTFQQCQTSHSCQPCTLTQPCHVTQPCQTAVTQPGPMLVTQPPVIYPAPSTPATPPTTTSSIPSPTTTTTQRPPIIDKRCPPGTILIYDYCHLIYCGSGIYRDGKCIITICPEGTIWTGSRCKHPEPQNQTSLFISNVINTNVDHTSDNHVINYINNLVINVTDSPIVVPPPPPPRPVEPTSIPLPLSSNTSSNCCYIVTPQTCFWEEDQYQCASRKYRRCGSICTAPYISLKPPTVMPPPPPAQPCQNHQCEPFYPDCNACDNMSSYSCQTYCQRTICQTTRCQSINLMGYCRSYPGAIGCRRTDGCLNDWCY